MTSLNTLAVRILRPATVVVVAAVLSACGGSGDPLPLKDNDALTLLGSDPETLGGGGESRELTVSESTTEIKSIVQCFCDSLYRSTLQIYHFPSKNAVLMIDFDNTKNQFTPTAVLHLFATEATPDQVAKWINNQHSDGLFVDPARPQQSVSINSNNIAITSSAYVESLTGYNGDEYEKYQVEFTVANYLEADTFHLNGFSDQAAVYLQTRAPDFDN